MNRKYLTIAQKSSGNGRKAVADCSFCFHGLHWQRLPLPLFFRVASIVFFLLTLTCQPLCAQEKGKASYYSHSLHGRKMSDGTPYHRDSMVCAHKRYPLGTMLKVTNLNNGKSVVVKVADRGPHAKGRIIDLSYRAAKEIGMVAAGIAMVKVEPVKGDIIIPYKPDNNNDLPELGFEVSNIYDNYTPEWLKKEDEPKPLPQEERREIMKDNHKVNKMKSEIHSPKTAPKGENKKTASEPAVSRSNPHKASQRH